MTDGTRQQQLIKWKYAFIKADHGREYAEEVPCYDDFITFPDNINPQQVVDGKFWNLYHPMKFKPEPGEFPNIDKLMEHIFGEQKELGYDYRACITRAEYGQVHLHALPPSVVRGQRDLQY